MRFLASIGGSTACFALLFAAACGGQSTANAGGTAGGSGTAGSAGAGGAGGSIGGNAGSGGSVLTGGSAGSGGGTNGAEGSYDLVFKDVVVKNRPGVPATMSPSEGASVRLDLRRSALSYDAVVTPRWGTPAAYTVTATGAELKLTGAATVSGGSSGVTTDKWTELHLGLDPNGALSGTVQGSGEETILMGDVIDMATVSTGGNVKADTISPELRSEIGSPILPMGQLLPWDTLRVRAAEGVDADKFGKGLSVRRANPDPAAPMPTSTWVTEPTDATSWAGAVTAAGKIGSWDEVGGISMVVGAAGASIVDRTGHSMPTSFSSGFTFLDLNLPTTGFPLEAAPTPVPAHWGDAVVHGMTGVDAVCESGVCIVLGPFDNNYCGVGRRGLAARLSAPHSADGGVSARVNVRVRYRVLAAMAPGTPGVGPGPFSIDVVALGGDPKITEIMPPAMHDLGAGAGELRYASDFLDAVAPGPDAPSASELGFAIYAGTRNTISCGPGGGLLPPAVKTEIVIDKITIEPG